MNETLFPKNNPPECFFDSRLFSTPPMSENVWTLVDSEALLEVVTYSWWIIIIMCRSCVLDAENKHVQFVSPAFCTYCPFSPCCSSFTFCSAAAQRCPQRDCAVSKETFAFHGASHYLFHEQRGLSPSPTHWMRFPKVNRRNRTSCCCIELLRWLMLLNSEPNLGVSAEDPIQRFTRPRWKNTHVKQTASLTLKLD